MTSSVPWVSQRLLNRDLLVVGYWTDWDYLNQIITQVMNAINPSRVIVVDTADGATFPAKAPGLYYLGQRAANGFHHVKLSGANFLAALRRKFSDYIVRAVLHSGAVAYADHKGVAPDPASLDLPRWTTLSRGYWDGICWAARPTPPLHRECRRKRLCSV